MAQRKIESDKEDRLGRLAAIMQGMSVEQLRAYEENLPPHVRQVAERIIAMKVGAGWRADPLAMGIHFGQLEDLPHTRLLARKFREAFEGTSPRQIWNLPPQHGKSLLASRWGPIWALDTDPTIKLGIFSYADRLARDHAVAVRDQLVKHGDELRARLRVDRRRQNEFVTVEQGRLMAAGLGGSITGFSLNGVIVDDPFSGWEQAHSEATRRSVWNGYQANVATRLNHRQGIPAFVIVVQTRWHEEDLTGMLEAQDERGDGEGWEVIRLPALAEKDDPLGRQFGEALAPTLHDATELAAAMRSRGSYLAAGLYQQRPAPEEGGEIKRAWFRLDTNFPPQYDFAISSWDVKLKEKESGDYVVGQAWGRTGTDMWCFDMFRGQFNFPTLKAAIVLMAVRHPQIGLHLVENTGNGPEAITDLLAGMGATYTLDDEIIGLLGITDLERPKVQRILRNGLPPVIGVNVKGDKKVRVRRNLGIVEARRVHLPANAEWTGTLLNECAAFGSGTGHDDCVDAMTQALDRLKMSAPPQEHRSRQQVNKPKPSARATSRR